ncbi:MAG TPA: rRNA maturation RNase YbeY [Candidatus Dormibacteraeota bacterium]|nr:rRNA maturation RNase YbeY [Candidatus Dormibacteraeota bacterium]
MAVPDFGAPATDRTRVVYISPWRVEVVVRGSEPTVLPIRTIARAAAQALDAAGAPTPGSVTIVLTDDAELTDLNAEHLGVVGPTDVLSFPMLDPAAFPRIGKPSEPAEPAEPAGAAAKRRIHIGDIAISVERAIEQAVEGRGGQTGDVRWSPADEMRLLVTHGTLHLCGWDHAEPGDESAMRALERRLLSG